MVYQVKLDTLCVWPSRIIKKYTFSKKREYRHNAFIKALFIIWIDNWINSGNWLKHFSQLKSSKITHKAYWMGHRSKRRSKKACRSLLLNPNPQALLLLYKRTHSHTSGFFHTLLDDSVNPSVLSNVWEKQTLIPDLSFSFLIFLFQYFT